MCILNVFSLLISIRYLNLIDWEILRNLVMETPLSNAFKIQIKSLSGFGFQEFVVKLFLLKHGADDFIPLREHKDEGCDGIIKSQGRVIACYGPDNYNEKSFYKKAKADFDAYKKNWEQQYPNWAFIVNHELSPEQIKTFERLKPGTQLIGIQQILSIIENELNSGKRRKLAKYLNISSDYLVKDFLKEILDDLLQSPSTKDELRQLYNKPIYIEEKIKLNFDKKDVQTALEEYKIVAEYFSDIENLISSYDDDDIDKIKHKFIYDYSQKEGSFKKRLDLLTKFYLEKYSSADDDECRFYIRALLLYIFEQCLIGDKTQEEEL